MLSDTVVQYGRHAKHGEVTGSKVEMSEHTYVVAQRTFQVRLKRL